MILPLEWRIDGGRLGPDELRAAFGGAPSAPPIEHLLQLARRLPAGLVHAEAIWILTEAPAGFVRLAEESPWFAHERSLAVVIEPREELLHGLLADLAGYAQVAHALAAALAGAQALRGALANPPLSPSDNAELSLRTGDRPAVLATVDRDAPGLWAEVSLLSEQPFRATVWIHEALQSGQAIASGQEIAAALAGATYGPAALVVAETPLLIEHFSPYVRDLGHALYAWAAENRERIEGLGLTAALSSPPNDDRAALIAAELLAGSAELLEERREAEASQGLVLADRRGTTFGHADLSQLAAPDPVLAEANGRIVWLIAGGAGATLVAATRALLETQRVTQLVFVGEARYDGQSPLVPEALTTEDDAIRLSTAGELVERAKRLDITVELAPDLDVRREHGAWPLAAAILGLFRRAQVKQWVPAEAPVHACFYPRPLRRLDRGQAALLAARLGLSALSLGESQKKTPTKTPAGTGPSRYVRRFRA